MIKTIYPQNLTGQFPLNLVL